MKKKIFSIILVLVLMLNSVSVFAAAPPINQGTTGHKTLSANWTPTTYSITYNLDGGSITGQNTTYNIETPNFTLPTPTKSGYTFTGWSGTGLTGNTNKTVTISTGSTGNLSYTAHWSSSTANALKFSSDSNFTLKAYDIKEWKYWNGTLEYSTNNGTTWNTWDGNQLSGTATQPIYIRGRGNTTITCTYYYGYMGYSWEFTGKYCTGNIETLLDYQTVANGQHPTMASHCYSGMFSDCTNLTIAPELPATTLTDCCYAGMFNGCTSLTKAPELPATTLAGSCYYNMFKGCTSLKTPPALPATTLANYCYEYMFKGCTSLTTLPELPATTLANCAYEEMFKGCTSLKISTTQTGEYQYAYRIPTTGTVTNVNYALTNMFTDTGGTFTGTPSINTTYYTTNPPVAAIPIPTSEEEELAG